MLREQMRSARLLTPYRRQITFQPGRMLSSIREHEDILDAIRNGDHERAASLMRKHVNTLAIGVSDFLHYLERSGTQEILAPSDGRRRQRPPSRRGTGHCRRPGWSRKWHPLTFVLSIYQHDQSAWTRGQAAGADRRRRFVGGGEDR